MCGIVGIWRFDGAPVDVAAVERAADSIRHRGPDDEGYLLVNTTVGQNVSCGGKDTDSNLRLPSIASFRDQYFDLVLGFRRLSILDLSPAGHQPMSSADARLSIVFNGEIYNYRELRSELKEIGFSFLTETDTEVILAAYTRWGKSCLEHFNGMFAFAIWDSVDQSLFIARDRFGEKPLFYSYIPGKLFAFASEMKALWAAGVVERTVHQAAGY